MRLSDNVQTAKGHFRFSVYDGDVERRALTPEQCRENLRFAAAHPNAPFPLHVGTVVSRPIETIEGDNLVVTTGKQLILDRLFALAGAGQVTHMGVGNSATAAAVGDTQLLGSSPAPVLLAFDALPTRSGLVVSAIRTYATGEANQNWQELATFNGGTNGTSTMLNRIAPIGPFNKTSAVSITVTLTLTQS